MNAVLKLRGGRGGGVSNNGCVGGLDVGIVSELVPPYEQTVTGTGHRRELG